MEILTGVISGVIGAAIGFLIAKFWKSRKIDSTVNLAKQMAKDPSSISVTKAKEIAEIWR